MHQDDANTLKTVKPDYNIHNNDTWNSGNSTFHYLFTKVGMPLI